MSKPNYPSELKVFKDIINFKKPKRSLRSYTCGFWTQTQKKWHEENGIPIDVNLFSYFNLEADPDKMAVPGRSGGSFIPFTPTFEKKIISEDDRIIIIRDIDGIVHKEDKQSAGRQFYSFPVTSIDDWKQIKERLDPKKHDFGEDYDEESKKRINNDTINMLLICGPFAFHRNLMGYENLSFAYYDMPELIEDMSAKWLEFYWDISKKMLKDMRIDFVLFHEDMAYKTGPLISPDLFNRFIAPYYKDMISSMKKEGVEMISVDSDGNLDLLLPLFTNLGINIVSPIEQAAGNDIFSMRSRYPELVMWGGIDKRVLNNGKEAIKNEIYSKVSILWDKGGYIPCLDHSTQPCPLENFMYMIELLDEVCN